MSEVKATTSEESNASAAAHLPQSRIRTIMKSSADPVSLNIKDESLQVVTRAAEMFIQLLAKESHRRGAKPMKSVDYKHLADYVQSQERLEFLHQIVPKKITVRKFRAIMAKKKQHGSDSSSGSEESESESGSESGDGDEKKTPAKKSSEDNEESSEEEDDAESGDEEEEESGDEEENDDKAAADKKNDSKASSRAK